MRTRDHDRTDFVRVLSDVPAKREAAMKVSDWISEIQINDVIANLKNAETELLLCVYIEEASMTSAASDLRAIILQLQEVRNKLAT